MCFGYFNFYFFGEIFYFLVFNFFIGYILDGNGIRFVVVLFISYYENKDVCCVNLFFFEEVL